MTGQPGEPTDREGLLGQVADEFLRRLERGERPDMEQYLANFPHEPGLRDMLEALLWLRVPPSEAPPEAAPLALSELGDFQIVREIGRGGMGVVYEAIQRSLNRRVALKVLPLAATLDARQLQRFKNEAFAAGNLRHPNIVPVHTVGCERGVHYYAMQLIDGQSLAGLIAGLRQEAASEPAPTIVPADAAAETPVPRLTGSTRPSSRTVEYDRTVARLGIDAALALDHAHSLGVIHRDIKPGNLLLDSQGKLWVTDFGLAHVQSDTRLTMTGDVMGTLRYMSPEQALGQPGLVDGRSDVYSLGVTLYELLTLQPAFVGDDRQEVLRRIAFEDPLPPRRIDRAIPVELETIVLKAMAREPADRYATARDLAEDLRCFLEDRPVRARRATLAQIARKWARRHRGVVSAALVGLAVVFLVLVVSSVLLATAYHAEAKHRREAEEKLEIARQAINDWYHVLGWIWLDDEPEMEPVQLQFLTKAASLYEQIAGERPHDFQGRLRTATAYLRLGEVRNKLDQTEEAREALSRALECLDADTVPGAERSKVLTRRAITLTALGDNWRKRGDLAAARRTYQEAAEQAQAVCADDPERDAPLHEQGRALALLGSVLMELGQYQEGLSALARAEGVLRRLVQRNPGDARGWGNLGQVLNLQSVELLRKNDLTKACAVLTEAIGFQEKARRLEPRFRGYRLAARDSHEKLALARQRRGEVRLSLQHMEQAVALSGRLVEEFPRVARYRAYHIQGLIHQADFFRVVQRFEEARVALDRALALCREPVSSSARPPRFETLRGVCHEGRGKLFTAIRQEPAAGDEFRQAIYWVQQAERDSSFTPTRWRTLATSHLHLGSVLRRRGESAASHYHLAQALRWLDKLQSERALVPEDRSYQIATYVDIGQIYFEAARWDDARRTYEKAVALAEALTKDYPDLPSYGIRLVAARTGLRRTLARLGREAEAEQLWQPTLDLLAKWIEQAPDLPDFQNELANQWEVRARVLGQAGKLSPAKQALRRSLAVRTALARRFPTYRLALAESRLRAALGRNLFRLPSGPGEAAEIDALLLDAISLLETLRREYDERRDVSGSQAARRLLARALHRYGTQQAQTPQVQDAERRLRLAIDLRHGLLDEIRDVEVMRELGENLHDLAVLLAHRRQLPQAEEAFREALDMKQRVGRLEPEKRDHRLSMALTFRALAQTVQLQGRFREALQHAETAVQHHADHAGHNFYLASLLIATPDEKLRNPAKAVPPARIAVARGGNDVMARRVLATALLRSRNEKEARDLFLGVVREKPVPADYFLLALAEWHRQDAEAARRWLRRGEAAVDQVRHFLEANRDSEAVRYLHQVQAEARKLIGTDPGRELRPSLSLEDFEFEVAEAHLHGTA